MSEPMSDSPMSEDELNRHRLRYLSEAHQVLANIAAAMIGQMLQAISGADPDQGRSMAEELAADLEERFARARERLERSHAGSPYEAMLAAERAEILASAAGQFLDEVRRRMSPQQPAP